MTHRGNDKSDKSGESESVITRTRYSLEALEPRLCLSLAVETVTVTPTPPDGSVQITYVGTSTVRVGGGSGGNSFLVLYPTASGNITVTLRGVRLGSGTLMLSTSGADAPRSTHRATPAKDPAPPAAQQPDDAPAVAERQSADQTVGAIFRVNPSANDGTTEGMKLVSGLDEVLGVNESLAGNFIAGAIMATSGQVSAPSTGLTATTAIDSLARLAAVSVFATYGDGPVARMPRSIAPSTPTAPTAANFERLQQPHDVLIAAASPMVSAAARRFFGFTPLNMPFTLSADPIASLAEDFASLSAPVLSHVHTPGPWDLTFAVLAADVILVAYIHRRWLRVRVPRLPGWPEAYAQPCSNI